MTETKPCTLQITLIEKESPTLKRVVLAFKEPESVFEFQTGQYVKLSKEGRGESYFAIASAPEERDRLEFLVRDQNKGFAHELFGMKEAEEIVSTLPMGKGFPLSALEGKHVIFIACGSGISPIASCIRSMFNDSWNYKDVLLLYGEKTPEDFAYREEMQRWEEKIKILKVVSRPKGTQWKGLVGHVQDHLKGHVTDGKNTVVCFSGMKEMIEDATKILKDVEVPEKNILLNY